MEFVEGFVKGDISLIDPIDKGKFSKYVKYIQSPPDYFPLSLSDK